MESQLNPNAAEFIPSPTQQRSIEQFLQSDTAVEVDAELMPMPSKTEEGILKVPFASDNFGSISQSEKLPDLINGQKNDLSSDSCQLEDIGVGAPTTISDSAEDIDFSDQMAVISHTENVPQSEISSALIDQGSEKKCNVDISSDFPASNETLPTKLISDSAGFPEFLDTHVNMDDTTNVPVQVQESSEPLSPVIQEFEQLSNGSESAAIAELDQHKELGVHLEQLQELSELDVCPIPNKSTDMEAHMPMLDQNLVENKCASSDNELNKLIDQIPDDPTNLQDDASSFHPGDKAREPIHISFELQKDIAPEMESQPELVKLNGEDCSLSFDIQESVLEETIHEIDESVGASPETPVELDANSPQNLMDGSPREDMASDHQSSILDAGIKANIAEMEQTPMSDATESLHQKGLDNHHELEPKVDIQPTLSSLSSPVDESSQKLPEGDYEPLPPDHPLNVCVFPLDNIKDKQDHFGVSSENEFDVLQKESVTILSGQENESSQGLELNQHEIECSSDIAETSPKVDVESPIVTMTPPPTPLTIGVEGTMVDVQNVLDVDEKSPDISKITDSLQKVDSSTEGEVAGAAAVAATVATAAAAVAADANLKKSEPKKPAAKKPLPEKTKTTTTSKAPVRSKPVPSKTVKSVPTSPTKPASVAAVPKPSPKKLPASAPITKPAKVQSPTPATTSVNRSKPNGLAPKPAPSLLKSKPSSGSSPVTLTNTDAGKPSTKRPETVGNKTGTGTSPASRIRPVSAPTPPLKLSAKPAVSKTTMPTTARPSTASTNGSVTKSKVSSSLPSRPKTIAQSKVASVKEGKESVNKQISSSRTSNMKPSSASTVTRTVAQSSTRKVESKLVGNSACVTKTSATTTTPKTATSKLGTKKQISSSVTSSSSSAKTKVSVSSENRESVEVTSVITSNEVKCDQAMFENAAVTE
ncbi:microtubule-associated protein 4 isoform X2 [Anabrus simplex]